MCPKGHAFMNNDTLFRLTLARDLGKTLAELDATLGPGELDLWRAYYERDRARHRAAVRRPTRGNVNATRVPSWQDHWHSITITAGEKGDG
jgi:hypothetical protein